MTVYLSTTHTVINTCVPSDRLTVQDKRELLKDKDKFDYYTKKVNEFYTQKRFDNIQVYPHFSKPKGLTIIINEIDWAPNPNKRRNGSEKDAEKLEILFRELGYEIYQQKTLENLTKKEMLDHLEAFATDVRHKDGSSCIVVIMSHGNEDVVCDTKGTRILINHEIKPLFNGKNAKDLVGKPKLFIYQSCRGGLFDSPKLKVPVYRNSRRWD
uniref:Caspase family p20 domain-containing protein n=1 Tax=Acrobeloides nanus TaxID=290746 RepID=A0A914CKL0_9BILA